MREVEIIVLRLLEDEFPLCPRPFLELACRANRGFCRPRTVYLEVIGPAGRQRSVVARHKVRPVSEGEVISAVLSLVRRGHVRRVAGVFAPVPHPDSSSDSGPEARRLVRALEAGLPLVREPYQELARRVGLPEEEVIERIRALRREGRLRRVAAVLGPPTRSGRRPCGLPERR